MVPNLSSHAAPKIHLISITIVKSIFRASWHGVKFHNSISQINCSVSYKRCICVKVLGPSQYKKCRLTSIGIPMLKIRRSHRPSYLWHGNPQTWERRSLYWDGALVCSPVWTSHLFLISFHLFCGVVEHFHYWFRQHCRLSTLQWRHISVMASQIAGNWTVRLTLVYVYRKLRSPALLALYERIPPVASGFSSQRAQ